MIVDANLLIFAIDTGSPHHPAAAEWWTRTLNSGVAVGLPWQTIGAFLRISTHPRVAAHPLTAGAAWEFVQSWLDLPSVWIPAAGTATARIYDDLNRKVHITGNLVPDGMLAAQAIEHGVELVSADGDFARFPGLRWRNPLMA